MVIIAIDGACRGNGKPDCLSTGAVFVKSEIGPAADLFKCLTVSEKPSTNQRGELYGLITALTYAIENKLEDVAFISDSEYIVNCINKEWYKNWVIKGWITAAGEPVKNRDLWETASLQLGMLGEHVFYHVKGHVLSVGKVTAANIMNKDTTGKLLYEHISEKYATFKEDKKIHAANLFLRNHGFVVPTLVFKEMLICNTVADTVAGIHADMLKGGE